MGNLITITNVLGSFATNCYTVANSETREAIIIDPADNCEQIINFCNKYEVIEIIVTHHHFDHIGALNELENYYNQKLNDTEKEIWYNSLKFMTVQRFNLIISELYKVNKFMPKAIGYSFRIKCYINSV